MGIVLKQSFKNTLIIYLGFIIGGLNVIIFYPRFLGKEYYGVITVLLAYANLIMPLIALGVHYTVVKFYSSFKEKKEKDKFLTLAIFLPLLIAIPIGFLWSSIQDFIVKNFVAEGNIEIKKYTLIIYIIAVCCAYFEVFYSWAKVQLRTVLGNFLKEFYNRAVIMLLLFAVFFEMIETSQFMYVLTVMYIIRTLIMMFYAFSTYFPNISFSLPHNYKEILYFSFFIILAGSAGALILDIDKVMIIGKETFEAAAYYTVAVFIGSFIEAPSRAMNQILQPLTSKSLNENNEKEVESLYKKSSINLLLIGGLFFLLINCNVAELFKVMPLGYENGVIAVLLISLSKLFNMFLGNNTSIIANSKYYKITLLTGLGSAVLVYFLNMVFYHRINMDTDGLALATLITIVVFNTFKLSYVHRKFGMTPITNKTKILLLIIFSMFLIFYFWNFAMPQIIVYNFPLHPLLNIIFKSILIIVIYTYVIIKLNISSQINQLLKKIIK